MVEVIDDFNDDLSGWTLGDTGEFSIDTGVTKEGAGSLTSTQQNNGSTIQSNTDDGLSYPQPDDDPVWWWVRVDRAGGSGNFFQYFQVGSDSTFANSDGYRLWIDYDTEEIRIYDSANEGLLDAGQISGGIAADTWYLLRFEWLSDGTLTLTLYDGDPNNGGSSIAQCSATDTSHDGPNPIKIRHGEFNGTQTTFHTDYIRHETGDAALAPPSNFTIDAVRDSEVDYSLTDESTQETKHQVRGITPADPDTDVDENDTLYDEIDTQDQDGTGTVHSGTITGLTPNESYDFAGFSFYPSSDGGDMGTVTFIEEDEHPNLYFNSAEIQAMRDGINNETFSQLAVDSYNNHIKGVAPESKPSDLQDPNTVDDRGTLTGKIRPLMNDNMWACFDYMIDPTVSKANALRDALMTWVGPQGSDLDPLAVGFPALEWAHDVQWADFAQFTLPFMYDLLLGDLANNSPLSQSDIDTCDYWFKASAEELHKSNSFYQDCVRHIIDREGVGERHTYSNWFIRDQDGALLCAMVSHEQTWVDVLANSEYPKDTTDHKHAFHLDDPDTGEEVVSTFAPATRGPKNHVNGLIYPSEYDFDGYQRNYGFDAPSRDFTFNDPNDMPPDSGQGQIYHHGALKGLKYVATAMAHNGFNLWEYSNQAMRRIYVKSAPWQHTAFYKNQGGNYDMRGETWPCYRYFKNDSELDTMFYNNPNGNYTSDQFSSIVRRMNYAGPIWGETPVEGIDL